MSVECQVLDRIVHYLDDMEAHWTRIVSSLETSLHREPPLSAHGWAIRATEIVQSKSRYNQVVQMRADLLNILGQSP